MTTTFFDPVPAEHRGPATGHGPAADPGTVLGVWAHPDDEAYLSAGLMLAAREAGRRVVVVTATDGELGSPATSALRRAVLARRRRREIKASLRALGVYEHRRLGYPDGGCARAGARVAVAAIAGIIDEVRPQTLVTFGPDGVTGHEDHRTVGAWTVAAAAEAGYRGRLWFPTLTPEFHERWGHLNERVGLWMEPELVPSTPSDEVAAAVHLVGRRRRAKFAALRAQRSQTAGLIDLVGEVTFATWWSTEWFRDATAEEIARAAHPAGGRRAYR